MALQDVRATARLMRKQPFFTAGVLVMLALGIGATTAIFSVVYGVLLKPLPFPEPDRIVQVYGSVPARSITQTSLTEANGWDIRDMNRSLEEFGLYRGTSFTLTGFDLPERVSGATVSVGFFRSLRAQPVAGRLFAPGEDDPGAPATRALLSHGFWTRRFGADPSMVGRAVSLDGRPYEVIGVLPPGTPWLDAADVFVPLLRRPNANRGSWEYVGIGRLKDGVTIEAAQDDLRRVGTELEARYPANKGLTNVVQPSRTWIASDELRRTLWILLGAVGLLLVIACVNVTNLLLARASTRVRESAVRAALGATRKDLIRERLTESLILSAVGARPRLARRHCDGPAVEVAGSRRHSAPGRSRAQRLGPRCSPRLPPSWSVSSPVLCRHCRRRSRTSWRRCATANAARLAIASTIASASCLSARK